MKLIDKIRAMSVEELADFLIISGETTDSDENDEGVMYEYSVSCWLTPWGIYPEWWSREDVKAVVIDILLSGG